MSLCRILNRDPICDYQSYTQHPSKTDSTDRLYLIVYNTIVKNYLKKRALVDGYKNVQTPASCIRPPKKSVASCINVMSLNALQEALCVRPQVPPLSE